MYRTVSERRNISGVKKHFKKSRKLHNAKTDLPRPIAQDAVKHRPMHVAIPKNFLVQSVAAK